jgi:kinesin family protein 5
MNDNLPIHEDKQKGVYVKGMLEVFVGSVEEVYEAMRRGQSNRVVAFTSMNAESSRSHSIFMLQITQKNIETGSTKTGKMSLVDLAGSEKVGKTGATGQTLEEAKKINKSLSALGMVINALTDGKSSHVPYRDSKLTRILQESLGGNSRTTLIINCSPSTFNEPETVSTLRFGMRAKSIKNKVKINEELSPAELKSLLRKAKNELEDLENQVRLLNAELSKWRSGISVPNSEWVQGDSLVAPALIEIAKESSSLSFEPVSKDTEEEFLRRENELQDLLSEREKELLEQRNFVQSLEVELKGLKEREIQLVVQNKELNSQVNDLKLKVEKLDFETKESAMTLDSLKESNLELESQIEILQKQVTELQLKKTFDDEEPSLEKRKEDMMKAMMDHLELGNDEQHLRDAVMKLSSTELPPTDPAVIEQQHYELAQLRKDQSKDQKLLDELQHKLKSIETENNTLLHRKEELESKLQDLEQEYEQLLEKTIQDEEQLSGGEYANVVHDLKTKLEIQYAAKKELRESEFERLKLDLVHKNDEIESLKKLVQEHVQKNDELAQMFDGMKGNARIDAEIDEMRRNMQSQLIEFEAMKKKLMRDLQERCERVLELELSLDETRQQYHSVVTNSQSRVQQKKMQFLERNLEQLTNVQKQLVEQNSSLKKQVQLSDKKLEVRNERIESLETELQQTQQRMITQEEIYQSQISELQAKLKDLELKSRMSFANIANLGTSWIQSSKIVKPLRGGLAGPKQDMEENVFLDPKSVTASPRTLNSKRSSWYISLLKK